MAEVCWQLGPAELVKGALQPAWLGLALPVAIAEALSILQNPQPVGAQWGLYGHLQGQAYA